MIRRENFHTNTMAAFDATQSHNTTSKPGFLTMEQVVCMMDGLTAVRICCAHAFHGLEGCQHFQKLIDELPGYSATIAKARRTLALWHKWTRHDGPTLSNVQSFLWDTRHQ